MAGLGWAGAGSGMWQDGEGAGQTRAQQRTRVNILDFVGCLCRMDVSVAINHPTL